MQSTWDGPAPSLSADDLVLCTPYRTFCRERPRFDDEPRASSDEVRETVGPGPR